MKQFTTYTFAAGLGAMLLLAACSNKRSPGWEYMPDMAHSTAFSAYSENPNFSDGMTSRQPVPGTVPLYKGIVGNLSHFTPYAFPNTNEGYDAAGRELRNPVPLNSANLAEGERLYNIHCNVCHGPGGKGNGSIVENPNIRNPFPPPPSYFTDQLLSRTEGHMYHVVVHGRNLMGSYASQLNDQERWQVIHHVKSMQQNYTDSLRGVQTRPVPMTPGGATAAGSDANTANQTATSQSR